MSKSDTVLFISFHQPKCELQWDRVASLRPPSNLVLGESNEM
jgi:hypothetical protein